MRFTMGIGQRERSKPLFSPFFHALALFSMGLMGWAQSGDAGPFPYWNRITGEMPVFGGTGNWDNSTHNWASDPSGTTYSFWDGDTAIFSANPGTVTLTDASFNTIFNLIEFSSSGYTITPFSPPHILIPQAGATIQTDPSVTATIDANLIGAGSMFKTGTGTLNISGIGNTFVDTLALDGGTTNISGAITSAANTYVGNVVGGNLMTLTGSITNGSGNLGVAATSSNNTATVTGASAFWTSTGNLNVGYQGTNNILNVVNGALVTASSCNIGAISGATNNSVNVGGTSSMMTLTADLLVGDDANNNTLMISNGGQVNVAGQTYVGFSPSAGINSVTVDGGTSILAGSGTLYVGFNGSSNSMTIQNGGRASSGLDAIFGWLSGVNSNSLTVQGSGSEFDVNGGHTLYIGKGGSFNSMLVSQGARVVVNKNGRIGYDTTSSGNDVTVTDPGSFWSMTGTLRVGSDGSSNTLHVLNGGSVTVGTNLFIGYTANAANNSVIVDGNGSNLTAGGMVVGVNGTNSVLTVADAGLVSVATVIALAGSGGSGTVNVGTGGDPGNISTPSITGGIGPGKVVFNHSSSNYLFSPAMINALQVQLIGTGTTILTGSNIYTGPTTITSGTLQGGAANVFSPSSAVAIGTSGTLSLGGFNQKSGPIANNGLLDLGGSTPGTVLTVAGTYNQGPTGRYRTTLNTAGQTDFTLVEATASLGGTLLVVPTDGYTFATQYHLLHSNVARNNKFATVITGTPLVIGNVIYLPQDVYIEFLPNLAAAALTENEQHVAEQIDGTTSFTPDALAVLNALVNLPIDQATLALDALAGEQYTFLTQLDRYGNERLNRIVYNALRTTLVPRWCACSCEPVEIWFQFGEGNSYAHQDINSDGMKGTNWDVTLGAFMPFGGSFIVGLAANYQYDHVKFFQSGHTNWNTGHASLHAIYQNQLGYVFVDGIVGRSWGHFQRTIDFGTIHRVAKSKPSTIQGLVDVEVGMNYYLCDVLLQPFVAGEFGFYHQRKIRECGADSINLSLDEKSFNTFDSYLGVHATTAWDCLMVNADLAWQHSYNSWTHDTFNEFQDIGFSEFSIDGIRLGHDAIQAALNLSKTLPGNLTIYGEVFGEYWSHWSAYTLSVGISKEW